MTATSVKARVISELMRETMDYIASLEKQLAALRKENELLNGDKMPPILSPRFISEYCGVSSGTVSDWLLTGEVKAKKVNGRWLIKREDFMSWLNDERTGKLRLAK